MSGVNLSMPVSKKFKVSATYIPFQDFMDDELRVLRHHLTRRNDEYYKKVRHQLNDLIRSCKKGQIKFVYMFIEAVKHFQAQAGFTPPEMRINKKHRLSDHAFCMALVRMYHVDLDKVKDRVLEDITTHGVRVAESEGRIITVLGQ